MKMCVRCKTENSADYKYCKTCGAELPFVDKKPIWEYDGETENTAEDNFHNSDEISTYEMNVFVGKNSNVIVPKFVALGRNNKKVSFCLPVFLLGFFLGPIGVAAYFLYRKMTKPAVLIMAVSIAVSVTSMAVNFAVIREMMQEYTQLVGQMMEQTAVINEVEFQQRANELVAAARENMIGIFSYINEYVLGIALPIVMALFADYMYKEHSIAKISECKAEELPKTEYFLTLHRRGGTSGGAVALGIAVYLVAEFIVVLIPVMAGIFA